MRVAAVDCGTNTLRLLITELDAGAGLQRDEVVEMRVVRLGEGVDRTGRLSEEAMGRAFAVLDEYAALVGSHHVEALRFCATSAARDAANADEFAAGVRARLGVEPEVVSGDEEARLSYDGATRSLRDLDVPVLVVDIGGGSTECVLGDGSRGVRAGRSLNVGSVRVTERLMRSDPPSAEETTAATAFVDAALDTLPPAIDLTSARSVVGVAGTITTVAAMAKNLTSYDRDAIHHARIPLSMVHKTVERLLGMTVSERRALPFMHPGRADVVAAGALILDRILRRVSPSSDQLIVSEADILDGIAWSLLPVDPA